MLDSPPQGPSHCRIVWRTYGSRSHYQNSDLGFRVNATLLVVVEVGGTLSKFRPGLIGLLNCAAWNVGRLLTLKVRCRSSALMTACQR